MNCLTAIYNAERFNNKCMKVALFIDLTDKTSRYVQSAFALHQLFIFNVAMQFIPVNKDVCLIYYIYIYDYSSISAAHILHYIYIYKNSRVAIQ